MAGERRGETSQQRFDTSLERLDATQFVTLEAFKSVSDEVRAMREETIQLRDTINGKVEGVQRVPGLVDVVSELTRTMASIRRVMLGVGVVLLTNFLVQLLHDVGVLH